MFVMCSKAYSGKGSLIHAYILGSTIIPVKYVIRHSVNRAV